MKEKPGVGKVTSKNVYHKAFIHKIMSFDIYAHIIQRKMCCMSITIECNFAGVY